MEWLDDDVPYDHGMMTPDEIASKFDSNEWTGPYGCVVSIGGSHVASLWGIVLDSRGTRDPYARVVVAELADEAEDQLRAALGAAQDGAGLA